MSKYPIILFLFFMGAMRTQPATAQCSICTRTAQQLGERPAKALNRGIIYLAFTPLAICVVLGYRWWKSESHDEYNDERPGHE